MKTLFHAALASLSMLVCAAAARAQNSPAPRADVVEHRDLVYAGGNGAQLKLDLYIPAGAGLENPAPLIVWMHGGGWIKKSKESCFPLRAGFVGRGYAVASIDYRLSDKAKFPAQLEDCKAAVRWLRAHAAEYNIAPGRIGAWGSSAGGHLAMLLGLTGDACKFDVGAHLDVSSCVQAVVDFFGPADLTGKQAPLGRAEPHVERLLGGPVMEKTDLAAAASPLTHVSKRAAPLFIIHGTSDSTVNVSHAKLMRAAMGKAGAVCELTLLEGAGHGGKAFYDKKLLDAIDAFFSRHLKSEARGGASPVHPMDRK